VDSIPSWFNIEHEKCIAQFPTCLRLLPGSKCKIIYLRGENVFELQINGWRVICEASRFSWRRLECCRRRLFGVHTVNTVAEVFLCWQSQCGVHSQKNLTFLGPLVPTNRNLEFSWLSCCSSRNRITPSKKRSWHPRCHAFCT